MLGNCFPMLDNLNMINNFVFSHLCLWGPGVLYFVCAVRFCAPRGLCWCCVGKYLHCYISGINLSPYPTCRYWLTDISCPFGCVDDVFVSCIVFLVFHYWICHMSYYDKAYSCDFTQYVEHNACLGKWVVTVCGFRTYILFPFAISKWLHHFFPITYITFTLKYNQL